jgi:hypothetical protein
MRSSARGNGRVVLTGQHIPGMGGDWFRAVGPRETYALFTLCNGSDPMSNPFFQQAPGRACYGSSLLGSGSIKKLMIVEELRNNQTY